MGFDPRENYNKMKTYYEALSAKYDAWMKLIKFILLLIAVVTSGWTATTKMTSKQINELKEEVGISHDVDGGSDDTIHGKMEVSGKYGKEAPQYQYKEVGFGSPIYQRALHNWFWLLVFLFFGYLFVNHSVGQVKGWGRPKNDSSSSESGTGDGNEPK